MNHTYFVMTPGAQMGSFVQFPNGSQGNYFKFGDTNANTRLGVRAGYTTHNPDFGVAAVLTNNMPAGENLGTKIKNDIVADGFARVPGTEWFDVHSANAWGLFSYMLLIDGMTIDAGSYGHFRDDVLAELNENHAAALAGGSTARVRISTPESCRLLRAAAPD
ncbi:hypothetical protein [Erythrobacter sp. F6033]|uniref:hypothetical protein n=1 Tax=Erythrobacter sp. F6033 TaxID=2926401 RepID=UPI001FF5475E|nr:hypothetical protein [Erythrobacter sp. F6033]MCK0127582.1 hypothetical protein [Erythrobacter sp. F6033]